jgi:DMSO/TMAO reductase YedYZ molybdopterin-dependent catalytic subunit
MRNNFSMPSKTPPGFEIAIPGRPHRYLQAAVLDGYEQIEKRIVLECAGNGRTSMDPVPDGTPWDLGGASVIEVRGVRLVDVLGGLPDEVTEIVFTGADSGEVEPQGLVQYQFSIDRDLGLSDIPLLVTHIAGEPLTLEHGAPVRLVVPGHYAMKSVKWLIRIEGVDRKFEGHFVDKYRYFGDSVEPEGARVGPVQIRSLIASPADGDIVEHELEIRGTAWSGEGSIVGVDVSVDNGATWAPAFLAGSRDGPVGWHLAISLPPGLTRIVARATDSAGKTQPITPRWNSNGYANNVCHSITVTAAS